MSYAEDVNNPQMNSSTGAIKFPVNDDDYKYISYFKYTLGCCIKNVTINKT